MNKDEMTIWALLGEAIGIVTGLMYLGFCVFYCTILKMPVQMVVFNVVVVVLFYTAFTLLAMYPEYLNRFPKELCVGKIRKYSIRMARVIKLFFMLSLIVPGVFDLAKMVLPNYYSATVIFIMIVIAIYYEIQIYRELRKKQ